MIIDIARVLLAIVLSILAVFLALMASGFEAAATFVKPKHLID